MRDAVLNRDMRTRYWIGVFSLFLFAPTVLAQTPCEELLRGGYSALRQIGANSLAAVLSGFPEAPTADANFSAVLLRLENEGFFQARTLSRIAALVHENEVLAPTDLTVITPEGGSTALNLTVIGTPERLRRFLTSFAEHHDATHVKAALGLHERNMMFVNNDLDPLILGLSKEEFPGQLTALVQASEDRIHLVNKSRLGLFFVAMSKTRFTQFNAAVPAEYRQYTRGKMIKPLDLETLTFETLLAALNDLQRGDSQIALREGGEDKLMLISVFDLAMFQRLHAQLTARFNLPLVRLSDAEMAATLEQAASHRAEIAPPPPRRETRTLTVSQIFTEGIFREFYEPGGDNELSKEKPSFVVKVRSRIHAYILSAEALQEQTLDEIKAMYLNDTGAEMPAETEAALYRYKNGNGGIEGGTHGQLWTTKGAETFNRVRQTHIPFLVVGEMGERVVKQGARPRFFILPAGPEATAGDEPLEPPPSEESELHSGESVWEDAILSLMLGVPIEEAEDKTRILQRWLAQLRTTPPADSVEFADLAHDWKFNIRDGGQLASDADRELIAVVDAIAARFLELNPRAAEEPPAPTPESPITEVMDLMQSPQRAQVEVPYRLITQKQETFHVRLDRQVVRELFQDRAFKHSLIPAFLRALRRGFIGQGERSGIKRLTNFGHNMIEVKIPGSMSQARLLGCLEDGPVIRLRRLIYKGSQSSGGLERYKNLCDEASTGK